MRSIFRGAMSLFGGTPAPTATATATPSPTLALIAPPDFKSLGDLNAQLDMLKKALEDVNKAMKPVVALRTGAPPPPPARTGAPPPPPARTGAPPPPPARTGAPPLPPARTGAHPPPAATPRPVTPPPDIHPAATPPPTAATPPPDIHPAATPPPTAATPPPTAATPRPVTPPPDIHPPATPPPDIHPPATPPTSPPSASSFFGALPLPAIISSLFRSPPPSVNATPVLPPADLTSTTTTTTTTTTTPPAPTTVIPSIPTVINGKKAKPPFTNGNKLTVFAKFNPAQKLLWEASAILKYLFWEQVKPVFYVTEETFDLNKANIIVHLTTEEPVETKVEELEKSGAFVVVVWVRLVGDKRSWKPLPREHVIWSVITYNGRLLSGGIIVDGEVEKLYKEIEPFVQNFLDLKT